MIRNSDIKCVGELSIYASSLVLSVIYFMWWILKFTCACFHHVLDFSEGWKLRLRAMARMEVFQDFSHNSKPSGVARSHSATSTCLNCVHFCSPYICIIASAIDLSENIVAIICREKLFWGFEEWVIESLTDSKNIFKALVGVGHLVMKGP